MTLATSLFPKATEVDKRRQAGPSFLGSRKCVGAEIETRTSYRGIVHYSSAETVLDLSDEGSSN